MRFRTPSAMAVFRNVPSRRVDLAKLLVALALNAPIGCASSTRALRVESDAGRAAMAERVAIWWRRDWGPGNLGSCTASAEAPAQDIVGVSVRCEDGSSERVELNNESLIPTEAIPTWLGRLVALVLGANGGYQESGEGPPYGVAVVTDHGVRVVLTEPSPRSKAMRFAVDTRTGDVRLLDAKEPTVESGEGFVAFRFRWPHVRKALSTIVARRGWASMADWLVSPRAVPYQDVDRLELQFGKP